MQAEVKNACVRRPTRPDDLANLLVEMSWQLGPRTKAHAAVMAAVRAAGTDPDFAEAARQLARAGRIVLYDERLDAAYRVMRRIAGAPLMREQAARFLALADMLGRGDGRTP